MRARGRAGAARACAAPRRAAPRGLARARLPDAGAPCRSPSFRRAARSTRRAATSWTPTRASRSCSRRRRSRSARARSRGRTTRPPATRRARLSAPLPGSGTGPSRPLRAPALRRARDGALAPPACPQVVVEIRRLQGDLDKIDGHARDIEKCAPGQGLRRAASLSACLRRCPSEVAPWGLQLNARPRPARPPPPQLQEQREARAAGEQHGEDARGRAPAGAARGRVRQAGGGRADDQGKRRPLRPAAARRAADLRVRPRGGAGARAAGAGGQAAPGRGGARLGDRGGGGDAARLRGEEGGEPDHLRGPRADLRPRAAARRRARASLSSLPPLPTSLPRRPLPCAPALRLASPVVRTRVP